MNTNVYTVLCLYVHIYKYAKEDIPLELFTQKVYCIFRMKHKQTQSSWAKYFMYRDTHTKDETSEHRLIKITDSTDTRCRLLKM